MQAKGIKITSPNCWAYSDIELPHNECIVSVKYSSICRTDFSVIDGSLIYYQIGKASYPIVTGHEWCGVYDGQPVVGLCILGCNKCTECLKDYSVYCKNRKEVGIVNKNGAHATHLGMPEDALLSIPSANPKYTLIEPLAVALHGLKRIQLSTSDRIIVYGYGCIGRMVANILRLKGYHCTTYDIKDGESIDLSQFDTMIECSGYSTGLKEFCRNQGARVLLFGFDYDEMCINELVSNEINIYTTLGSIKEDFRDAISMMPFVHFPIQNNYSLLDFDGALKMAKSGKKVIIDNTVVVDGSK